MIQWCAVGIQMDHENTFFIYVVNIMYHIVGLFYEVSTLLTGMLFFLMVFSSTSVHNNLHHS